MLPVPVPRHVDGFVLRGFSKDQGNRLCFAHRKLDCSPPFTVVITFNLPMMLFFLFPFVLFVCLFFLLLLFFYSGFVCFGGGLEVVLRVPLMNRHQSTFS